MAEKKNPDYSANAVNLTNPVRIRELLAGLYSLQESVRRQQAQADACVPTDLKDSIAECQTMIDTLLADIRVTIDELGSYQDIEGGHYALKQRRVTITYSAAAVRTAMPDFAKAVIEETVNKAKIEGLAKGGLITPAQVEAVSTKAESFRYVIN